MQEDILKRLSSIGVGEYCATIEAAVTEIARLQSVEAAAKNLVAQKGRHNTEIAYKRLEETLK